MNLEEFIQSLTIHMKQLEAIADNLDKLGSEEQRFSMQQAILNQSANVYDVLGAIRFDMMRLEKANEED
ncbi:MAG: hypothetical protein IJ943_03620 [Akkermansia sp.]|nr:hypothetical protein [Akkermansia sp.]MBR3387516.1 hypothetical protein [Bacteroidales bacterium]